MSFNRELIRRLMAYWGKAQDVELTLSLCRDDMVFRLHTDLATTPYAGEYLGKDAARNCLYDILTEWDYLSYEADFLGEDNGVARVHSNFQRMHRSSGDVLTASKRVVVKIRDGLISEIDVFEDAPLVAAFIRLAERHMQTSSPKFRFA